MGSSGCGGEGQNVHEIPHLPHQFQRQLTPGTDGVIRAGGNATGPGRVDRRRGGRPTAD